MPANLWKPRLFVSSVIRGRIASSSVPVMHLEGLYHRPAAALAARWLNAAVNVLTTAKIGALVIEQTENFFARS